MRERDRENIEILSFIKISALGGGGVEVTRVTQLSLRESAKVTHCVDGCIDLTANLETVR